MTEMSVLGEGGKDRKIQGGAGGPKGRDIERGRETVHWSVVY